MLALLLLARLKEEFGSVLDWPSSPQQFWHSLRDALTANSGACLLKDLYCACLLKDLYCGHSRKADPVRPAGWGFDTSSAPAQANFLLHAGLPGG